MSDMTPDTTDTQTGGGCAFGCGPYPDDGPMVGGAGFGIVPACPTHGWMVPLLDARDAAVAALQHERDEARSRLAQGWEEVVRKDKERAILAEIRAEAAEERARVLEAERDELRAELDAIREDKFLWATADGPLTRSTAALDADTPEECWTQEELDEIKAEARRQTIAFGWDADTPKEAMVGYVLIDGSPRALDADTPTGNVICGSCCANIPWVVEPPSDCLRCNARLDADTPKEDAHADR